jgi:hypothetical protein
VAEKVLIAIRQSCVFSPALGLRELALPYLFVRPIRHSQAYTSVTSAALPLCAGRGWAPLRSALTGGDIMTRSMLIIHLVHR